MSSTSRFKVLAVLAASSVGALALLQACSGDDSGSDAGPDGTTTDASPDGGGDAQNDVAPGYDSGCPTYTGSSAYCQAAVAKCNACGTSSVKFTACDLANFDAVCNWASGVFSPQAAAAQKACATTCDVDASNACVNATLADAGLSATQEKTVTDYCSHCNPSAGCAATTGAGVIELNDTVAASIDTQCTPDAGGPDSGKCAAFQPCVVSVLQAAFAASPCDGG